MCNLGNKGVALGDMPPQIRKPVLGKMALLLQDNKIENFYEKILKNMNQKSNFHQVLLTKFTNSSSSN